MAKKPASPKSSSRAAARSASAMPDAKDIAGETPSKAPSVPDDAPAATAYAEAQGQGGETHQVAGEQVQTLTTQQGVPVADDQNSLKQGSRGITSVFPSASSMRAVMAHMASSN